MKKMLTSLALTAMLCACGGSGTSELVVTTPTVAPTAVPTQAPTPTVTATPAPAIPTATPTPPAAPTATPIPPTTEPTQAPAASEVTLEELEPGFCLVEGYIENEHSGFSGEGYANTNNETGAKIQWQVVAEQAGSFDFEIRYAATSDRAATLATADSSTVVAFLSSGAWTEWTSETGSLELSAGINEISLSADTVSGAPNIDAIKFIGAGLSAGSCIYTVPTPAPPAETEVFVIGDSTAANYGSSLYPQKGWGQVLQYFFDDSSVTVTNRARGGRSSRGFYTEPGLWDQVIAEMEADDYLLIQFGHNDRDFSNDSRYTPPEDFEVYLTSFVNEARAKGVKPILISPMIMHAYRDGVLRNVFTENGNDYRGATLNVATALDVPFIDLNMKSFDLVSELGADTAKYFLYLGLEPGEYSNFPNGINDGTHFQEFGAIEMARLIVEGMEELSEHPDITALVAELTPRHVLAVDSAGATGSLTSPSSRYPAGTPLTLKVRAGEGDTFNAWYHLGEQVSDTPLYQTTMPGGKYSLTAAFNGVVPDYNPDAVTVFMVGDSTMANYASSLYPQTGWGQVFQHFFDPSKVTIDNRALGGRSSKSFYENHWQDVQADIQSGDFVFIQFGINDRNTDDPDRAAPTGGVFEGYLSSFAADTQALGATPVFISTVRRNQWQNGSPYNAYHSHPVVTGELAAELGIPLIDLDAKNKALLESVGEDYANQFYYMGFAANEYENFINGQSDTVHFQEAGAVEIARLAREAIVELQSYDALAPLNRALKPLYNLDVSSPTPQAGTFTRGFSYPVGTPLTLKALAEGENIFTQWLDENNQQVSDSHLYRLVLSEANRQFAAVFNNSEGLGIPRSGLQLELDASTVNLTWQLANFVEPISNVAIYREDIAQENSAVLLLDNAGESGAYSDSDTTEGLTYRYFIRITQGENSRDLSSPDAEIRVPLVNETPVTNLEASFDGEAVNITWNLQYFDPAITYLELYRNDENAVLGRGRLVAAAPLEGSFRDENLEPGKTYWYMFKVYQGDNVTNTTPEGETAIPADSGN